MLTMQTSKGVAAGLAMLGAVELLTTDSLAAQKFSDVEAGQPWTARELGLHGLVPGDF